jgi:hypothetical protein
MSRAIVPKVLRILESLAGAGGVKCHCVGRCCRVSLTERFGFGGGGGNYTGVDNHCLVGLVISWNAFGGKGWAENGYEGTGDIGAKGGTNGESAGVGHPVAYCRHKLTCTTTMIPREID